MLSSALEMAAEGVGRLLLSSISLSCPRYVNSSAP